MSSYGYHLTPIFNNCSQNFTIKYKYDSNKSLSNEQKHGINFENAKLLWNDDRMVEILTSYEDEKDSLTLVKSIPSFILLFQQFVKIKFELSLHEEQEKRRLKSMKAEKFDKIFDDNEEDIIEYLDLSTIKRPNLEPKRINIDFPTWMVKKLDEEAQHIGVSRQAIIKTWLADKIMQIEHHKEAV